jgi:proteasome lid subunit RPN8/RPN11
VSVALNWRPRPGVGPAKATALTAALELGRRLAREEMAAAPSLDRPEAAGAYLVASLRGHRQEVFGVLSLDVRHRFIAEHQLSIGTRRQAPVEPSELFRRALMDDAASVILFHNHPSGHAEPSLEDLDLTRRLANVAVDRWESMCWITSSSRVRPGHRCAAVAPTFSRSDELTPGASLERICGGGRGAAQGGIMRRALFVGLAIICSAGLVAAATTYGQGVNQKDTVAIADLLASPADYVDKTVSVEGTITGVCKKRGCWMQISDAEGNGIRIKVEDGVMVFPYTSMGRHATAEGVFTAIPVKTDHDHGEHQQPAEHKGDCESAETKTESGHEGCAGEAHGEFVYQIQGTGAIIDA